LEAALVLLFLAVTDEGKPTVKMNDWSGVVMAGFDGLARAT